MNYMIAEACSQGHDVLIIAAPCGAMPAENLFTRLPMNLSRDVDEKTPGSASAKEGVSSSDGNGLKIAWQYGKYLNKGSHSGCVYNHPLISKIILFRLHSFHSW